MKIKIFPKNEQEFSKFFMQERIGDMKNDWDIIHRGCQITLPRGLNCPVNSSETTESIS